MLNGNISVIKYHGGLIAGDLLWIELWTPFTTHLVTRKEDVNYILSVLKEWKGMVKRLGLEDDGGKEYLRWKLEEEKGW